MLLNGRGFFARRLIVNSIVDFVRIRDFGNQI